jgi:hypothetical protein
MADNVPEVVEAQRFVLRDALGRVRAALETAGDTVRLIFRGRNGKVRAALGLDGDSDPGLDLYGRDETPRATLSFLKDGAVGVILRDGEGTERLALAVHRDGMATLLFHGPDGGYRAELGVDQSGLPRLLFCEPGTGAVRVLLAFLPDGTPSFALARKEGIIWGRPWRRAGTTASIPRGVVQTRPDRFLHPAEWLEVLEERQE